ncbi:brassinosteroid-responsive RING protein 1-like [Rhodamnia argentea]|uniref:Brassinosteroid-responsive RING protein 1-like n=1 Tax=Rhodamnia argentea TaxID=178133 RepID=A0A8B8Q1H8_9MYRT|nr:brassinosteroid-responsive RING protein 1-like [Rhodamnia argentea]
MGFPAAYTEISLPKLLFQTIPPLRLIGNIIASLLRLLGFPDFLETDPPPSPESRPPVCPPVSAVLIREFLPLIKYRGSSPDPPESCTVCMCEFAVGEEIRELKSCKHAFHRSCLDRWMSCDQRTCPLCRTQFVPKGMQEWLWDAAAASASAAGRDCS